MKHKENRIKSKAISNKDAAEGDVKDDDQHREHGNYDEMNMHTQWSTLHTQRSDRAG